MKMKWYRAVAALLLGVCVLFTGMPGMEGTRVQAASIPSGAARYKDHYYKVYKAENGITWTKAKSQCEKLGGHLVSITSSGEQDFVAGLVHNNIPSYDHSYYRAWIGLRYQDGKVRWVTGEKLSYTPSNSYKPTSDYPYGCIYYSGIWGANSSNTATKGYYICEWDSNLKDALPGRVTSVKARKASSTSVTLTWSKLSDAKGYAVYMKTGEKGTYKKVKTVKGKTTNSTYINKLKKGNTYYFRVRAYKNIYGERSYGELSNEVSIKLK